ncbi:DUF4352 domain-containing protein [Shouchella shacheensis]|uniref:DUF4352 domain-containing protein n=1 Tax=Shouchella shacheensis TaxID=1649580 RepID=UPI0007403A53|nr:DUF4352 domain-containing protein [Shouchella shacheensis]
MKEKLLVLLGLSVCLILIIGFTTGNFSNEGSTTSTSSESSEEKDATELGETQEISGMELTVNSARTEESNVDEQQVVLVDVTIENTTDSSVNFSLYNLTLMDEENYAYEHTTDVETKGILGGQISAGRAVSGEVAYDVPKGTNYELVYTDHFRNGQLFFPVEIEE